MAPQHESTFGQDAPMTPEQAEEWIRALSDALSCPTPNHQLEDAQADKPRHKQYAGRYDAETKTIVSVASAPNDPSPVGQRTLLSLFAMHLHHMKGHTGDDPACCWNEVSEAARRLGLFDGEQS